MLSDELTVLLPRFVDGRGPSHDELSRMIQRAGLTPGDPLETTPNVGKVKRVRAVLAHAIDSDRSNGERFVKMFVEQVRACGGFRPSSPECPGEETIAQLRRCFRNVGFDLDPEGHLRPRLLENLEGTELTEALWAYVRRAQSGAGDAELVIGTAKNLEEATVRHVLKELTGEYPTGGRAASFPAALYMAFDRLGLCASTHELTRDSHRAVQEALFLLACAVNRLRNERGDGHGRPEPSLATLLESRLSSQSAGLVCELLLSALRAPTP